MYIMAMPGFTAEVSLYQTSGHYRMASVSAINAEGFVVPAQIKGKHCTVQDSTCSSGWSIEFCPDFNPDNCIETGECCTPPPPQSWCTVNNNRQCLPWPLDFICWGSCTKTCCSTHGDQVLCGVSPC